MNSALASPFVAQPVAVAAGAVLALLIFRMGRGRFALPLFLDAAALGALMGALIAYLEAPFDLRHNASRFSSATIAFLFAGLPEEAAKLIAIVAYLRRHYLARDRRDVALAAASLALGFAVFENMLYVANAGANWERLALLRTVTAAPFHVFLGVSAGYIASLAAPLRRPGRAVLYLALWLALAMIHGAYDFAVLPLLATSAPPVAIVNVAAALGMAVQTLLCALMTAAEVAAALAALAALTMLDRTAPPARPIGSRDLWRRVALSRVLGVGLGGLIMAGSALFLAGAGAVAYGLNESQPIWAAATVAVLPFALGVLLAIPQAGAPPLSPSWRRGLQAGGGVAAAAAIAVGFVWGAGPLRGVIAARIELKGLREAQRSDFAGAIRDYDRALGWRAGAPDLLSKRAAALAGLERFDAAEADLDRALAADPGNPELWVQRSEVRRQRHETAGAIADVDRALALKPDAPALLALDAQARLEANDMARAREDIEKAEALAPREPTTLRVAAAFAVYNGDYDAALRALNQFLHDQPADFMAGFARGRVWLYKRDWRRAIADFTVAERGSTLLYPSLWRFLAADRLGEPARFVALQARLKGTAGDVWPAPVARLYLGQITVEDMRAAAKDADQRCEAEFYWGELRWQAGDDEEAHKALQAAGAQCPSNFIEYEGAKAALRAMDK